MLINIGKHEFEINTKLGTAKKIEQKYKSGIMDILSRMGEATINEMLDIIGITAGERKAEIIETAENEMDYIELQTIFTNILSEMSFSGTPEQKEQKIDKLPADDETKNALRLMLGLPQKPITVDNKKTAHKTQN